VEFLSKQSSANNTIVKIDGGQFNTLGSSTKKVPLLTLIAFSHLESYW